MPNCVKTIVHKLPSELHSPARVSRHLRAMEEQDAEPHQQPRDDVAKSDDLEHKDIDRVQCWADEAALGQKLPGNQDGAATLLQQIRHFGFGQGATEFRFAVLKLGAQVFGDLGKDVLLLVARQPKADGLQIAVNEVCGIGSLVIAVVPLSRALWTHARFGLPMVMRGRAP